VGEKTNIEYLDSTWNPMKGCASGASSHQSVGCKNCWARRVASRFFRPGEAFHGLTVDSQWTGDIKLYPHELIKPVRWKRPRRVGVNFMGDMFCENADWRDQAAVFGAMLMSPQHQFLVLTKNPVGIAHFVDHLSSPLIAGWLEEQAIDTELLPAELCVEIARRKTAEKRFDYRKLVNKTLFPKNVWVGTSVENQPMADKRIKDLLSVQACHRWISVEPLLGAVNIDHAMYGDADGSGRGMSVFGCTDGFGCEAFIDFVVVGGESGPGYRPMDLAWARALRDECGQAGVAFFFKQTAGKGPIPEDMQVQQLPDELNIAESDTDE